MLPLLRDEIGRILYADMLRMEEFLVTCPDIDWTIMRPGRLIDGTGVSVYRAAEDFASGNITTRPDLAAAMLAELGPAHTQEDRYYYALIGRVRACSALTSCSR